MVRAFTSCWAGALALCAALPSFAHDSTPNAFDSEAAIEYSQSAIGREIGNHSFFDRNNDVVPLAEFRGEPLVVNLVYTSCVHTCPVIVQTLHRAVEVAQDALGADGFSVVTVGFDSDDDTPARMRAYAKGQGVDLPGWRFLSADHETIERLTADLGFIYFPSPRGFDHLAQTTVLDAEGRVFRQIYGSNFEPPALVEPLKALALGDTEGLATIGGLIDRVRLFCTFYDPSRDRYSFDYSIVIGITIGGLCLGLIAVFLVRSWLGAGRRPAGPPGT
jgi:protein SCO1/2